jgi:serine/threonine protein phosphatase PrpC
MISHNTSADSITNPPTLDPARKPRDEEIDVFGLTHPGSVRKVNQDHFLLCSLHKHMKVHLTSLPDLEDLSAANERLAFVAMVADGVGSGAKGGEASQLAIQTVSQYVSSSMQCYYTADATKEREFMDALQEAAMQCHANVAQRAEDDAELHGMATTLTLFIGVWPRGYLLQVGDSRFYVFRNGKLTQVTRDQTMAQELIDEGVLTPADAPNTRWAHVLSSAIGGQQAAPVVSTFDQSWESVYLLCSDGLTKDVPDERIGERLSTMRSAKQVCEDLLQDALDAGGSDNITVIVGRPVRRSRG